MVDSRAYFLGHGSAQRTTKQHRWGSQEVMQVLAWLWPESLLADTLVATKLQGWWWLILDWWHLVTIATKIYILLVFCSEWLLPVYSGWRNDSVYWKNCMNGIRLGIMGAHTHAAQHRSFPNAFLICQPEENASAERSGQTMWWLWCWMMCWICRSD